MAYKRQFYPGTTSPAVARRRLMDPKVKLQKLREVPIEDVVKLMGHRNPGEDYKSIQPPHRGGLRAGLPHKETGHPHRRCQARRQDKVYPVL